MPTASRDGDSTHGVRCTQWRCPEPGRSQWCRLEANALEQCDGESWGCSPRMSLSAEWCGDTLSSRDPGQVPTILSPHRCKSDPAEVGACSTLAWAPPSVALPLFPLQPSTYTVGLGRCCPGTSTQVQVLVGPDSAAVSALGLQASSASPSTHKAQAPALGAANLQASCPSSLLGQWGHGALSHQG